jgi:hypothetical protein
MRLPLLFWLLVPFLVENETSSPLTITYRTVIKKRLTAVENNMPPTIAITTCCRPSFPIINQIDALTVTGKSTGAEGSAPVTPPTS